MLMVHYLQRFLFKWKYVILIISIISAMVATFSFQINRWLPNYTLSFSNLTAQQFQAKISYRTVHYRFPTYVIFKDVKIFSTNKKNPMLQASRIIMGFPFPLFSSSSPFNYMDMEGMQIDFPVLKDYLTHQGDKIRKWAKTFPKGKIRFLAPNGRFQLKDNTNEAPITFKIDLSIDQDHLSAQGYWGNKNRYNYELYGNFRNSGFDLDKLTMQDGLLSSLNLWGSWHGNSINWKGFIFYDKFYILDIDGHLNLEQNDLVLKQLSFSINGDDVTASGHCSKQDLFQCDAAIIYSRQKQKLNLQQPLKNINLSFHAQNTLRGISFKGLADVYFILDPAPHPFLKSVHVDFEDLKGRIVNGNILKLRIKQIQSIFSMESNEHKVLLENLLASFDFARPYQKIIGLSARMYAGHLHSRIFLNTFSLPWQIKGQGKFEGIDMKRFSADFFSFKQCYGLFSGTFNLNPSKTSFASSKLLQDTELTGTLALHNGNFYDSDFQEWVAKTLQMPSLDNLSSTDFSCDFKIDGDSKMLGNLKLHSDDLDLSGFFDLDADDLVSSHGSVRFTKNLLSESPIGRKIIGLVRGAWTLPFEFSLSGDMHRMNFQWDSSPLKDKVRQHMFSFFERMIDRRMDAHPYYKMAIPNGSVSP
jgi:hypothetical protein